MTAALLPRFLPLSLRHLPVCETCVDADAVDLQPLIVQLLPELDEGVLDHVANLRIVAVERCLHCAVSADGDTQCQFAEVLRMQSDDHLRICERAEKPCLLYDLTRNLIVRLWALCLLCRGGRGCLLYRCRCRCRLRCDGLCGLRHGLRRRARRNLKRHRGRHAGSPLLRGLLLFLWGSLPRCIPLLRVMTHGTLCKYGERIDRAVLRRQVLPNKFSPCAHCGVHLRCLCPQNRRRNRLCRCPHLRIRSRRNTHLRRHLRLLYLSC